MPLINLRTIPLLRHDGETAGALAKMFMSAFPDDCIFTIRVSFGCEAQHDSSTGTFTDSIICRNL